MFIRQYLLDSVYWTVFIGQCLYDF